jgi:hypothetical protein
MDTKVRKLFICSKFNFEIIFNIWSNCCPTIPNHSCFWDQFFPYSSLLRKINDHSTVLTHFFWLTSLHWMLVECSCTALNWTENWKSDSPLIHSLPCYLLHLCIGKILECPWVTSVFFVNWTLSQTFQAVQEVHAGQEMPSHDTQQPQSTVLSSCNCIKHWMRRKF